MTRGPPRKYVAPPIQINIRIPAEVEAALKLIMVERGISMTKLVNEMIAKALTESDAPTSSNGDIQC
jgi:predicted HicB family RNase H-like nuclease